MSSWAVPPPAGFRRFVPGLTHNHDGSARIGSRVAGKYRRPLRLAAGSVQIDEMMVPSQEDVTRLLRAVQEGEEGAVNKLFPLVYAQLHERAELQRRQWHGDFTLNTTALVHEAYIKLADQTQADWKSRAHFLSVAAKAMRHILIDYAKRRRAEKRGGDVQKFSLEGLEGRAA